MAYFMNVSLTVWLDITEACVRRELGEEEDDQRASGMVPLHDTSASLFIIAGLELEDTQ